MADAKISALTALSAVPAAGDLFPLVDVSDTSMAASGTTKSIVYDYLIRLRLTSESVVGSNPTVAVNTHHLLDVSGMTANRNFVLPSGTAGDIIRVTLSAGDDTYALVLIGDTGVAINGGSTATEWSRVFTTGESVTFLCTAANAWWVMVDKRKPCIGKMTKNSTSTNEAVNNSWSNITYDTSVIDDGNIVDLANERFNLRRTNKYVITGNTVVLSPATGFVKMRIDVSAVRTADGQAVNVFGSGTYWTTMPPAIFSITAGQNVNAYIYQNSGSNRDVYGGTYSETFLQIHEVL